MKRCLVLSDSFKGTLSSPDICRIARSLHSPGWHIDALPVADAFGLALFVVIGAKKALLFGTSGMVAVVMRFVPYVGPMISAV